MSKRLFENATLAYETTGKWMNAADSAASAVYATAIAVGKSPDEARSDYLCALSYHLGGSNVRDFTP